ncbi:MAG: hypothetical protein GX280_06845, partial [Lentisphaerae bacterium]|nr:hypothetical protein [Lentisphaerota bacterium]
MNNACKLEQQRLSWRNREYSEVNVRVSKLWRLFDVIKENERQIVAALHADLGKSEFEA